MSLYNDLVRQNVLPSQALDAMAMGAKPESDDRKLFLLLARLVRSQLQDLHDAEREVDDAWKALGNLNRGHLTLDEAINSRLRELEPT